MVENGESDLYCETLEIRRSVLCIICLGTYCNPATLPCSHTFCRHCILEASRVRLKCPICSADFTKRSLVSETHFSRVVADVVGLVNSLTSKLRYSISIDALDGHYRDRQRIPITRDTPVTSRQSDEGLAQRTPLSTTLSYSAGGVNRDVSDRSEILNGPESDFEYCKVDEEALLNRKYASSIVQVKETTSVSDEQNNKKMECGETSSSRLGNEVDRNRFNERIYAETVDFIDSKEVSTACVYEFPIKLPSNDLQQKQDEMITSAGPIVDMKECGDQDVEVEIKAQELFRPGDIVTVIARMWPGELLSMVCSDDQLY
jgi:RING-type zinc-finger